MPSSKRRRMRRGTYVAPVVVDGHSLVADLPRVTPDQQRAEAARRLGRVVGDVAKRLGSVRIEVNQGQPEVWPGSGGRIYMRQPTFRVELELHGPEGGAFTQGLHDAVYG